MIFDINHNPWMKSIAVNAAERGIAVLGFQRYRNYWYVMVYGETDVNGFPQWAGIKLQDFNYVEETELAMPYVFPRALRERFEQNVSSV